MAGKGETRAEVIRAAFDGDDAIAAVYLFGSHARGTATRLSDIDIGLLLAPDVDPSRYFSLRIEYTARMMDRLGTERVEVVVLNDAPLHLAYEAVARGMLLSDRQPRYRAAFEADRIGRFLDFKPFLAVHLRAAREHLKKGTFFD